MKVTKPVIKSFEQEQKSFGTKVALHNVLWQVASALLKDLGISSIKTSTRRKKK